MQQQYSSFSKHGVQPLPPRKPAGYPPAGHKQHISLELAAASRLNGVVTSHGFSDQYTNGDDYENA